MNITYVIWGAVMICVGIFIVIFQIKWFKKGLKDPYGWEGRFLLGGFFLILGGIIIIVQNW